MAAEALYKVLNEDGTARMGKGSWPLPNGKPGAWMEVSGALVPCENGLHLCRREDLVMWLGPAIFEAEHDGAEVVGAADKIVVRRARLLRRFDTWNDRTARLFACDCAERALGRLKAPDSRSAEAVAVARRYAVGDATEEELAAAKAAAWDAWDAAWDARDAARVAARAAARDAAWDAAWGARDAARAAAGDAAWDAGGAARDAERAWQTERLFYYLNGEA